MVTDNGWHVGNFAYPLKGDGHNLYLMYMRNGRATTVLATGVHGFFTYHTALSVAYHWDKATPVTIDQVRAIVRVMVRTGQS